MFLQANPGSAKTQQEKEDLQKRYKPGDVITVKVERRTRQESNSDDEDRRIIEEARAMSLRDLEPGASRSHDGERGARHGHRSRESTTVEGREARQRRRRDDTRTYREHEHARGGVSARDDGHSRYQARQLEHQSSLRSLLSTDEIDSAEMEEEILRQIREEGLLEGIDLSQMDLSQEDALSERIADAYRRRHRRGARETATHTEEARATDPQVPLSSEQPSPRRRQHARSASGTDIVARSSRPPVSRPHMLEAHSRNQSQDHRHRTSSENRRQTSPGLAPTPDQRQAARSATDLSERPRISQRDRRPSDLSSQGRRTTESPSLGQSLGHRANFSTPEVNSIRATPRGEAPSITAPQDGISAVSTPSAATSQPSTPRTNALYLAPATSTQRSAGSSGIVSMTARPSSSSSATSRNRTILFPEPSITCERCGRENLEYELHENCSVCKDGNYNLCHRCYLQGRGCLHWFDFGRGALRRFQLHGSTGQHPPHTLVGHRYSRPRPENYHSMGEDGRRITTEDPATRLESGVFCSNCSAFANDCFWKCDECNEGEWGFCNDCVNKGKCCTHPLLPVAHKTTVWPKSPSSRHPQPVEATFAVATSPTLQQGFQSSAFVSAGQYHDYRPLTFSINCNICKYPIQPSSRRFHCYECNDGNYNVCTTCYLKLVANKSISKENGDKGWRRCLNGHRMIVAGFDDFPAGQRRIVVRDLVGGHGLDDEANRKGAFGGNGKWTWRDGEGEEQHLHSTSMPKQDFSTLNGDRTSTPSLLHKYPPDGGVGFRAIALWSYWPSEGTKDELAFPKRAEIKEMYEINEDWFCGFYCGTPGLVFAKYVMVKSVVNMGD
ncbi:MAG: hypothetical protein MMC33_005863 [Icmadophila ericetorum]|nr:hypothetical protein [Icmadophila ericetorum]